jgi:hypothetical protein
VIDGTDLEKCYRRIITLETALMGSLRAPWNGTSQMSTTLKCSVMDHPENEYKPGRCYCTAKESPAAKTEAGGAAQTPSGEPLPPAAGEA